MFFKKKLAQLPALTQAIKDGNLVPAHFNIFKPTEIGLFRAANLDPQEYANMSIKEAKEHARKAILERTGAGDDFRQYLGLDQHNKASIRDLVQKAQNLRFEDCTSREKQLFFNILSER